MDNQVNIISNPKVFDNQEGNYFYLGFLIWPFVALIAAFKYFNKPWAKNVFWFFCIFFGFTFIYGKSADYSADSVRIYQLLQHYVQTNLSFNDLLNSFYSESSKYVDIVQPLLIYLVSRVTGNAAILFTIFGLIFGFFYSRNIWYVIEKSGARLTWVLTIFIIAFALFNPIWNINGFRMYSASQVFLFGVLPYLYEKNSKKLFWSILSVFFHFSFAFPVVILLIFILIGNKLDIFFVFFIITSFMKEIDLKQVSSFLSFLPGLFQSRVSIYTNMEYAQNIRMLHETVNWYIPFSLKGITWIIYATSIYIYLAGRKHLKNSQGLLTLFCFSLLLLGFANIFSLVPSGGRFLTIANSLMFVFFILFLSEKPDIKGLEYLSLFSVPLLLLYCIISMRVGMDYYGLMTIFGNPVLATFYPESVPLITGIKSFLF